MANLFDTLYQTIDYEQGVTPWDVVETAIAHSCTPWYDPRFVKGFYELLFARFQNTARWIKGQYYAEPGLSWLDENQQNAFSGIVELVQTCIDELEANSELPPISLPMSDSH